MKTFGSINLNKAGGGSISLIPEEDEDLWHLFNIIRVGDRVRAKTSRKVKLENSTGTVNVQVKKMVLMIEVTKIDFEPSDKSIRLSGRNLTENDDIKLHQFHTLDIGLHEQLTVEKDEWDFAARDTLRAASDAKAHAEVAALLLESGQAALYVMTNSLIKDCGRVTANVSKQKSYGKADKSKIKFYETIVNAMRNQFRFSNLSVCIVGAPQPMIDEFIEWMFNFCTSKGFTEITSKRKIFVTGISGSINKNALATMLQDPSIAARVANTKAVGEVGALDRFHKLHNDDPLRACYGPGPVSVANAQGAIDTLLLSDELFRSDILRHRIYYSDMAQSVKDGGGTVQIIASQGVMGDGIKALASVAAVLRFPVYELEELEPSYLPDELKISP